MTQAIRTIEWSDDHIVILDQTLLPITEVYISLKTVDEVIDAIQRLAVRGAPALGDRLFDALTVGVKYPG